MARGKTISDRLTALFDKVARAMEARDVKAEQSLALRILDEVANTQGDDVSPWNQALEVARGCEAASDWVGALAGYQQAREAAEGQPMLQWKAQDRLSTLYEWLGREEEALAAAREATACARKSEMVPLLAQALLTEARLLRRGKDIPASRTRIEEALVVIEPGPRHDLVRSRALIARAACLLEENEWPSAEADLVTVWPLLEARSGAAILAGWQSALAGWWATTAELRSLQGDVPGAIAARRAAVDFCRRVAAAPQLEGPYKFQSLAGSLRDLGAALLAAGEPEAAEDALQESRAIQRFAGLPPLDEREAAP